VTDDAVTLDVPAWLSRRGRPSSTSSICSRRPRPPAQLGCFGLHEWAMVYRQDADQVRHARWPLRLARPAPMPWSTGTASLHPP